MKFIITEEQREEIINAINNHRILEVKKILKELKKIKEDKK